MIRRYHLWNANERADIRWRYYMHVRSAHLGALIECRWSEVGTTIEVYDAESYTLVGQYTRTPTAIKFLDADASTTQPPTGGKRE